MNKELEDVSRILGLKRPCGRKRVNEGKQRRRREAGVLYWVRRRGRGMFCRRKTRRKAAGWIKERIWCLCVCLYVCNQERERKAFFFDKISIHAKTDKLAAFPRSLCSYFVRIFVAERLSLKSPVSQALWVMLCLFPLSYWLRLSCG